MQSFTNRADLIKGNYLNYETFTLVYNNRRIIIVYCFMLIYRFILISFSLTVKPAIPVMEGIHRVRDRHANTCAIYFMFKRFPSLMCQVISFIWKWRFILLWYCLWPVYIY